MGVTHYSGLNIGSVGSDLSAVIKGTVSINLASIAAGAEATVAVTVSGAAVGDIVVVNPPALTAGLGISYAYVSATDTVTIRVRNASGGAIDEAAGTWSYLLVR